MPSAGRARRALTRASLQLLAVSPEHRASSLQDMRAAPSLAGVLWDHLGEKKVEPGFVPNVSSRAAGGPGGIRGGIRGGGELSALPPQKGRLHCDPTFELEEMILESRPLHKKKKRLAKSRSRDSSRDSAQSVSAGRGALCTSASCQGPAHGRPESPARSHPEVPRPSAAFPGPAPSPALKSHLLL